MPPSLAGRQSRSHYVAIRLIADERRSNNLLDTFVCCYFTRSTSCRSASNPSRKVVYELVKLDIHACIRATNREIKSFGIHHADSNSKLRNAPKLSRRVVKGNSQTPNASDYNNGDAMPKRKHERSENVNRHLYSLQNSHLNVTSTSTRTRKCDLLLTNLYFNIPRKFKTFRYAST